MKAVKLLLMLTLVLAACMPTQPGGTAPAAPTNPPSAENTPESTPASPQDPSVQGSLMGTQWILKSYGPADAKLPVVGETALTLDFSHEGQVSGNAGCNSFGGSYQADGNTLVLSEIASTLMACVDSALMEQELQYLDALQTVSTYEISDNELMLTYDGGVLNFSLYAIGTVMATPTPAPEGSTESGEEPVAGSLMGTQWILESYGPAGAEAAVAGETPLTLDFAHDGKATGNAGCNSFGTTYQADGNTLMLGEIVSTLMACADSALMEQEIQYLDALRTASTFVLDHDSLAITYEGGVLNFLLYAIGTEMATPTPAPEASGSMTGTDTTVSQPVATGPAQNFAWSCYSCYGNQIWLFENGQATRTEIPVVVSYFFGYSPATGRILYSTDLPALGAGPGQISVHDLWALDVASGHAEPLFSDQVIVEAEWAPDGEQFAYVIATETNYELRWRGLNGEDTLLASLVAFTFSVSPNGDKVAFTRESNYNIPSQPGFYVIDLESGREQFLSDVDRAGSGSIEDKPVWSPSGQYILLPTYGTTGGPGLLRAAVDGSGTVPITFDPSLSGEEWFEAEPYAPFWVSDTQLIASASLGGANAQMGGPSALVLYQLNETADTIVGGQVIADEGLLIGWDVPGSSVWVQVGTEMQSIPLPTL